LELEITETVVMQGVDEVSAKISRLRALGITVSIDDFGTGYSSLSYLQRLPIDCLKIDRSFVRDIAINPDAVSLTQALVSLAHSLGMRVVVEGIETQQQFEAVQRIGCDLAQGYLLGSPQPVADALRCARFTTSQRNRFTGNLRRFQQVLSRNVVGETAETRQQVAIRS
jgi:EAL domain-containing protein (putative c-di-GMP-specific phosphodiesterase class I)